MIPESEDLLGVL